MNKRTDTAHALAAAKILKELKIRFDFGFMLFAPWTTLGSLLSDVAFLEKLCGDGWSPVPFCKMLPYAETSIQHTLKAQGRLKGKDGLEDYDFLEPPIDYVYAVLRSWFVDWFFSPDGVMELARRANSWLGIAEASALRVQTQQLGSIRERLQAITAESNRFFLDRVKTLVCRIDDPTLAEPEQKDEIARHEERFTSTLRSILHDLECLRPPRQRYTGRFDHVVQPGMEIPIRPA